MKKAFFLLAVALCTVLIFTGCNIEQKKTEKKIYKNISPKRIIKNKILLILGKDYSQRPKMLDYLREEYGIGEDSPIEILSYEQMTKATRYPLLKEIPEKIEEQKTTILISIGIPEGGGRYLINESRKNKNLVIINLLPMDEILPLEAGSDLVIDFEIPTAILSEERDFKISDDELKLLLTTSVFMGEYIYAKNKNIPNSPIEEFTEAFLTTQKFLNINVLNNNFGIKSYIDPDTGIPSRKYLIIYEKSKNEAINNDSQNEKNTNTDNEDEIIDLDKLEGGA